MHSNNPIISVVMSVYNSEKYLVEAIESILTQTFADFEFIIINDGSTDSSLSIIKKYLLDDDRIVLISRENKGLPYSLNEGIIKARGKYIARMDADDISLPMRFEEQISYMESNSDIGVCGTQAYVFSEKSVIKKTHKHPSKDEDLKLRLLFSVCFIHPSVMIRKSILDNISIIYNEKYKNSQDYDLWVRLASITKFGTIQKPLIFYRVSNDSITHKVNVDGLTQRFPLVSVVHKNKLKALGIRDFGDEKALMHFTLSLNAEMANHNVPCQDICLYLKSIIEANRSSLIYNVDSLSLFLSKKYFIYVVINFRNKNFCVRAIFNKFFWSGLFVVLNERIYKRY